MEQRLPLATLVHPLSTRRGPSCSHRHERPWRCKDPAVLPQCTQRGERGGKEHREGWRCPAEVLPSQRKDWTGFLGDGPEVLMEELRQQVEKGEPWFRGRFNPSVCDLITKCKRSSITHPVSLGVSVVREESRHLTETLG